jgi:hypothetical protein
MDIPQPVAWVIMLFVLAVGIPGFWQETVKMVRKQREADRAKRPEAIHFTHRK